MRSLTWRVYEPPDVHVQLGDGDPTPPNLVGGPSTLDGLLSDVRIYARALSADRGSCAGERLPSCRIISLQDRSGESDVMMAEEAALGTQGRGNRLSPLVAAPNGSSPMPKSTPSKSSFWPAARSGILSPRHSLG